jgi:hypothetical protein
VFRVRILGGIYAPANARSIAREIEIAANQTLEDLGNAIPLAFGFYDLHLWSFFLSGKAWDDTTESALDPTPGLLGEAEPRGAAGVAIRDVPYPGKTGQQEFLYLFDYGDEWHFGVKLLRQNPTTEPRNRYPRVAARTGANPPQYPDAEEWDEEE